LILCGGVAASAVELIDRNPALVAGFFLSQMPPAATLCPRFGASLGLQVGACGPGDGHAPGEATPNFRFPSIAMSADAQAAVFAHAVPDRRQPENKRKSKRLEGFETETPLNQ
jgi:hypothetical protein